MAIADSIPLKHPTSSPLRLGIAGLGTVGIGVIRLLREHASLITNRTGRPLEVVAISARNRHRDRGIDLSGLHWYDNPVELAQDPNVDIIVELMGGAGNPARALVETALREGKAVVTANKALVAQQAETLSTLSQKHRAPLLFEAAVAGGIPAIKLVREGVAADQLTRLGGILNGTSNYILTEMEKTGRTFEDVLKEAQDKGYAEADPSADIDGWDAAHKLSILTAIAFTPISFDSLPVHGIRSITTEDLRNARKLGYTIKLLGVSKKLPNDTVEAWVQPCLIPLHAGLAQVHGVFNALTTEGPFSGPITISGQGAGEGPTASAVVADLIDLGRNAALPLWGRTENTNSVPCTSITEQVSPFYIRIHVSEDTDALHDFKAFFEEQHISIDTLQEHHSSEDHKTIIIMTHDMKALEVHRLLPLLEEIPFVKGSPLALKVEQLP